MKIDIREDHYKIIIEILKSNLNRNDKVFAYGSRVKGNAKRFSDLDLVVETDNNLYKLIEAFEESSLPYIVDISNYKKIPSYFIKEIEKNKVQILF